MKEDDNKTKEKLNLDNLIYTTKYYSYRGIIITFIILIASGIVINNINDKYKEIFNFVVNQINILNNIFIIEYIISSLISCSKNN